MAASGTAPSAQALPDGTGKLYAYEMPAMAPGDYDVKVRQTIGSANEQSQVLETSQKLRVRSVSPYILPQDLVHSYYPPRLRAVDAKSLPHLMLKGAVPWERSDPKVPPGSAPVPWLALLVFSPEELSIPAEVTGAGVKPSGTKALGVPLAAVNDPKLMARFCLRSPFSSDEDSPNDAANFIFVPGNVFRWHFESQETATSEPPPEQSAADLSRYKYLVHITDTAMESGDGHSTIKISTILGHRLRPYGTVNKPQDVHAHLVSLEGIGSRVDWNALGAAGAVVPLVSLFSWTYTWLPNNASDQLEIFEHLAQQVRPLAVSLPKLVESDQKPGHARGWVRARLQEGYTIVRHRDIAGETAVALYRGPLTPVHARRLPLRPSMHGTDLQIVDESARMLDVSYSVAWDLGRSLAGRDNRFLAAMASLRRQLSAHAISKMRIDEVSQDSGDGNDTVVVSSSGDIVKSVLTRLEQLFSGSEGGAADKLRKFPVQGVARWQVPASTMIPAANAPGIMTQAKLRRGLRRHARAWLEVARKQLCVPDPPPGQHISCDIPALQTVIDWVAANLLSLRLVPAIHLFPDPSVLPVETISSFVVDDTWVDALIDGALSVANAMGDADDPVRDEIRRTVNAYLRHARPSRVPVAAAGLVLRSSIVESFPDLHITAAVQPNGAEDSLKMVAQTRHDDMILCLFPRGPEQKVTDFLVSMKLPPHQQRFGLEEIHPTKLTFGFELRYFKNPPQPLEKETPHAITWEKGADGVATSTEAPGPFWNWNTGLLAPHMVASTTIHLAEQHLGANFSQLGPESQSVYLAVQLADRDHKIDVPFHILTDAPHHTSPRQLFPRADPSADEDRDDAVLHDPQALPLPPPPPPGPGSPAPPSSSLAIRRSWLSKKVFSLKFPHKSIPARSRPVTQLVFAVRPSEFAPPVGIDIEIVALDFYVPIGEAMNDLLDAEAVMPDVKVTDARLAWVAAAARESPSELVVRLRPRALRGWVPLRTADASFLLLSATVNGVGGDDVVLRSREMYIKRETVGGKIVETEFEVRDHWVVSKE